MKKLLLFCLIWTLFSMNAKADNWDYYSSQSNSPKRIRVLTQPERKGKFYVSPRLGINYLTNTDGFFQDIGMNAGIATGIYLENFRFDFEFNHYFNKIEQQDLFLNAYYHFKSSYITPFAGLGLGYLKVKKHSFSDSDPVISLACGVSKQITPHIAFEGMGRFKYALNGIKLPEDRYRNFNEKSNYFNLELLAGIRFSF